MTDRSTTPASEPTFFRTTITIEVLSSFKLASSSLDDINSLKLDGEVYVREVSYSSSLLSPADLDDACEKYENLDRDSLMEEFTTNQSPQESP